MKMHVDEVDIDAATVSALISEQYPHWVQLPVTRVNSSGTVNALFRLGSDMVVRLPRLESGVPGVTHEHVWLPRIREKVPVEVPQVVALGEPNNDYPFPWSIYRWIDGDNPAPHEVVENEAFVADLCGFILGLQAIETADAPMAYRGGSLSAWDEEVRSALISLQGRVDVEAAANAWSRALAAPAWDAPPVWVHSDLMPGNLLTREGRLTGVIDFEAAGIGDPACELMVAWNLLGPSTRHQFRFTLGIDDSTWVRGQGWALAQALVALPYYWDTNPAMVATARYALEQVLAEKWS